MNKTLILTHFVIGLYNYYPKGLELPPLSISDRFRVRLRALELGYS